MNILIISDDLTGATDSAAGFLSQGIRPRISLGPETTPDRQAAVEVVDLDVREKPSDVAAKTLRQALVAERPQADDEWRTLFLKIDSTLRGHVRAYVEALISEAPAKPILICPAFPELGRTVEGGQVKVFGETLGNSEYGRGQNLNNSDGDLLAVLGNLPCPIKHLSAQNTSYDENSLKDWFSAASKEPACVYVIDALDRTQMDKAIDIAGNVLGPCHYVGSGGLTRSLARHASATKFNTPFQPQPPTLWLIGSAAKESRAQIAHLDIVKFEADASGTLSYDNQARQKDLLQRGASVVVHMPPPMSSQMLSADMLTRFIESSVTLPIAAQTFVMTGGATARAALDKLGVRHLDLLDEILPGIPIGCMNVNDQICHIVLKSGGFGDEKALRVIQTYLNTYFSNSEKERS